MLLDTCRPFDRYLLSIGRDRIVRFLRFLLSSPFPSPSSSGSCLLQRCVSFFITLLSWHILRERQGESTGHTVLNCTCTCITLCCIAILLHVHTDTSILWQLYLIIYISSFARFRCSLVLPDSIGFSSTNVFTSAAASQLCLHQLLFLTVSASAVLPRLCPLQLLLPNCIHLWSCTYSTKYNTSYFPTHAHTQLKFCGGTSLAGSIAWIVVPITFQPFLVSFVVLWFVFCMSDTRTSSEGSSH